MSYAVTHKTTVASRSAVYGVAAVATICKQIHTLPATRGQACLAFAGAVDALLTRVAEVATRTTVVLVKIRKNAHLLALSVQRHRATELAGRALHSRFVHTALTFWRGSVHTGATTTRVTFINTMRPVRRGRPTAIARTIYTRFTRAADDPAPTTVRAIIL